jgi:Uma2 family endonuclease
MNGFNGTATKRTSADGGQVGASLGWLLDPAHRRIFVYRPGRPVEELDLPAILSGDPELPGFALDLQAIFQRSF